MTNQLPVAIEAISIENAPSIYKADGLKPFIAHIKEQVTGEVPDLTTKKGRDRVASLAAQVSRSKTAVEKPGREYLKHLKELPKTIEAELREFVNSCDALRDEVRKPLTEWEEAEQARIDRHKTNIAWFAETAELGFSSVEISHNLTAVEQSPIGDHCEEYLSQYVSAKDAAIQQLKSRYSTALQYEQQVAELARLQKEAAEREQKEREERIAREAAENARRQAELEAQRQREEEQRKANEEKLAAERREMQLKLDAENAERRRLEAEQRQAEELKQAELRAQQAAENERRRIEQEQAAAKAEADRQAANKAHRATVNREILAALVGAGLTEENAKLVITLAAKNQAGQLVINY
jgi:myosin heavy subunit